MALKRRETFDIQLTLSANSVANTDSYTSGQKNITIRDIEKLFSPLHLPDYLTGKIRVKPSGHKICYEQKQYYPNADKIFWQSHFDLFSNLFDNYPKIIHLGGQAIPSLQALATKDNPLHPVCFQLIKDIAAETGKRLERRAAKLICPTCLTHCGAHQVNISWGKPITYYGCRICGQSQEFLNCDEVIVVLDSQVTSKLSHQKGILQVNWLTHRTLFDFDSVKIVQATDEEVERFAVQVGNDTDPERQSRYKQLRCVISQNCGLSENTIRILQHTFEQVERNL